MQRIHQIENFMRSIPFILIFYLFFLIFSASSWCDEKKEENDLGEKEYQIACEACHGLDGKGDGPQAKTLSLMPADLTRIAKLRNGQFPEREIYDLIDGRGVIPAHGKRDMPIWGLRYRTTGTSEENKIQKDEQARHQIESLVQYLKKIQEKE